MPKYIVFAIVILTFMFDLYGILKINKRFQRQDLKEQLDQIRQWKNSRIVVFQDFIGFYEKMTMFIYFSISASLN